MLEAILVAIAVAAIEPQKAEPIGNTSRWVRARDLRAISADSAITTFDIAIDEEGEPIGCSIILSSGQENLDEAVCKAVLKRAKFRPASNENGSNIHSVRRDRVLWRPQGRGRNQSYDTADLVIQTPELQTSKEVLVDVLLLMSSQGGLSQCVIAESSGAKKLDEIACEVATNPQIALPITDENGAIVEGLRSFFVTFETGPNTSVKLR